MAPLVRLPSPVLPRVAIASWARSRISSSRHSSLSQDLPTILRIFSRAAYGSAISGATAESFMVPTPFGCRRFSPGHFLQKGLLSYDEPFLLRYYCKASAGKTTAPLDGDLNKASLVGDRVHATVILNIVKADANLADMPSRVGRSAQANQHVHLAHEAFATGRRPEPDPTVTHPSLEVIEQEQGFCVHIDVGLATARTLRMWGDLQVLQQRIKIRRPFDDGVLAQWHGRPRCFDGPEAKKASIIKHLRCLAVP